MSAAPYPDSVNHQERDISRILIVYDFSNVSNHHFASISMLYRCAQSLFTTQNMPNDLHFEYCFRLGSTVQKAVLWPVAKGNKKFPNRIRIHIAKS